MTEYHTRGPVPVRSRVYIERPFEDKVRERLVAGSWVLLLGPRQHGKTSALIRLRSGLREQHFHCALVDLQSAPPFASYRELLQWFSTKVASEFGVGDVPSCSSPDDLGSWLEMAAPAGDNPLFIVVDESSGVRNWEFRDAFFSQFRSIANEAAGTSSGEALSRRMRCVFAGTFRPEELVDERNSPFNVCERVESEDLTRQDARVLWSGLESRSDAGLADRAYDAVGGQPYLLQRIFSWASSADPEVGVEELDRFLESEIKSGEDGHLEAVFAPVLGDRRLSAIVRRLVAAHERVIPMEPANPDFRYCSVLGVVSIEGPRVTFRNPLYESFARTSPQLAVASAEESSVGASATAGAQSLIPLPEEILHGSVDERLESFVHESYTAACLAYNESHFRMAVVGFGAALEACLLGFLLTVESGEFLQAVDNAKSAGGQHRASFNRLEDDADPRTWRLVNLIRVARQFTAITSAIEPSDSVRTWRNLIHPAPVLEGSYTEDQLFPEAMQASGLVAAIVRDIARSDVREESS